MEKDFGSWFLHQQSDRLLPNLNTLSAAFNLGQQNTNPAYMSHCANVVSTNGTLQGFPFLGVHHSKASQLDESRGWFDLFDCLPCFQPAFSPSLNNIFQEKIHAGPCGNHEEAGTSNKASGCAQKRFVVFDQSGDETTLVFRSGVGTPVQFPTSWGPKLNNAYDLNNTEVGTGRDTIRCPGFILTDQCNENHRDEVGSDMHEDTEELNALLYSDDEDNYYEDEEEVSTGHSPSMMTVYGKQEWFDEIVEEVASSAGPTKRMKLSGGGYDVLSLMDTATSVEPKRCFDYEDDAESSCADGRNKGLGESVPLSGNKRLSEDNIRETVSLLQNIIPGGKDKDEIVILDEAINYLRSLKRKAEALGVDML